ncbi:hypothetical protein DOY81_006293 [Sarcophaga bullata]|nr:hypothetical protein DOY81_006293 [Sarcophaga bullata]
MSIYNEDELIAPDWINQEFLEKVLRQYEKCEDINSFDISPASMKGDHYASIMFRCKLNYKLDSSVNDKQKSLIIKTLPDVGAKNELLKESKVFQTEIKMYSETLPKIEKILKDCGEPTRLSAEIIYQSLEPRKLIIFEDLCESGFDTIRGRYLNEEELKLVYRKIAKLHAVSYMLGVSEDYESVTQYDAGIFCESVIMSMDLIAKGIFNFIEMLAKHKEFEVYLEKVKALQPEIKETCKALYSAYKSNAGKDHIFVLNHGDFHMRNLMFKLDGNQQAEDLIMVDYQISCFGPSNIDMVYSQYMLMSPELRLRRNEFMQYYFTEFMRMLKKMNFERVLPRYSEFQITGLKYRHFC